MNEIGPQDRPDLSQPPAAPQGAVPPQDRTAAPGSPPPGQAYGAQGAAASSGFDFNQPTIISLLYLSSFMLIITGIVAVVLAYVWKGENHPDWEDSHYRYHIRTFWIAFIGTVVSVVLMIVLIGFVLWLAVAVLVVVRSIMSLINAQKQQPMPNPDTWLA